MIKELDARTWKYEDIEFWKNPKDGCWNSIIMFDGERTRLRSSIIIMTDNNEILLCKDTYTGELCLPGGGFEPGETPEEVAMRESHEEVGIDVKDVEDTECDYCLIDSKVKDWVKDNVPEDKWWYNYYTCLMIGSYNKIFKGKIAEVDKEPALKNSAKFYPLDEIVNHPEFKNCWKRALRKYGYLDEVSLNEVYPNKGESKKDFIARFMEVTEDEYPDVKQRFAVANSYWDRRNKKKTNETLTEATLAQILNKSKIADKYKDKSKGDRWTRRDNVTIADEKEPYQNINMDDFWKKDVLNINFPITGETSSYKVKISIDNLLNEIASKVKENKNNLTENIIEQSINEALKSSDMKVNCNCRDYAMRLAYFNSKNKIHLGKEETRTSEITNPKDTKGAGCKHILKVLVDNTIAKDTAEIIFKYINYCKNKMQYNYLNFIFPRLFGISEKEARKLISDKNNSKKEEYLNLAKALGKDKF